jgi:hypothetical protein
VLCRCQDLQCPFHMRRYCVDEATVRLYRIDIRDTAGIRLCKACGILSFYGDHNVLMEERDT